MADMKRDAVLKDALQSAQQFIRNGVELGYIRMPAPGDPALLTPDKIDAALRLLAEGEKGEPVAVKALEWIAVKGSQQAETPFYGIEISPVDDDTGEHWATYIRQRGSVYRRSGTEADAKAAAQADYERRIRSALRAEGGLDGEADHG